MTLRPDVRGRGLLALAAAALGLAAFGALVDRADLFPRLRFAVQRDAGRLPSTTAVAPEAIARGLPTLSVYLEPDDLQTLLDNKMEHGRRWERRASLSYFDGGRLLFATGAGIRVHGGGSRITSPKQSWRIFFRRRYGAVQFAPGILFGPEADPLKRLVVHNDVRTDADGLRWHLVNPLAYDLAARIGCITPGTKPARFFLNGEDQGLFVLTEHFDDEYFEAHRPGRRITMELEDMEALRAALDRTRPLTMDAVAALVDLENLTSWFLAAVFAATRDAYQGPGQFLDEDAGRAGWFWVTWDLDQSFRSPDLDSFLYLLERVGERPRGRRPSEPRPFVLTTLIAEDAGYRAYLAARLDTMLNHQLTASFLEERRAHYGRVALDQHRVPDVRYLERVRQFLSVRPAFVRAIAEQWLNTPPGLRVSVRRPGGGALIVDGFAKDARFEGTYFPGREITVGIPDGSARWYVNGELVSEGDQYRIAVDRPLSVIALTGEAPLDPTAAQPPPGPAEAPPMSADPISWRRIPPGAFTAGCSEGDQRCEPNEHPREPAALTRGFDLMAAEATVAQYAAFARAAGRRLPRQPHWSGPAHPVVNLTYDEAASFCAASGGRLPTEIEWEYAARGGGAAPAAGPALTREAVNGQGLHGRDRWGLTAPVASFAPGASGLFDMIGNVWEWTSSWYREGAGWSEDAQSPPPPDSPAYLRTVRGGSWDSEPVNLRVSRRVGLSARGRHNLYVGVRCAR